jgi:hypothetical protein
MPARHPAEFLPPVLYRQRAWGGGDHYEFEVFDIAGAQPYRMKDGFLLPDTFRAEGWKLSLDPAYVERAGTNAPRWRPRRGWREFRFEPAYVIVSEWRQRSKADSFQETAEVMHDRPRLGGFIQERTGKLEFDGERLSSFGPYAYLQFLPLLEYARQFPPFVKS